MIKELTPRQEEELIEYREQALEYASNGERIVVSEIEPHIKKAYEVLGYASDNIEIVVCKSPRDAMEKIHEYKFNEDLAIPLSKEVVETKIASLRATNNFFVSGFMLGINDLYWLTWAAFAQHIGVVLEQDLRERFELVYEISKRASWWWMYEQYGKDNRSICFISEKPEYISWRDEVLHAESKPAVRYSDGFSLYSWKGVEVPKEWVETPEELNATICLTWRNIEQRRCACEIFGWDNILKDPSLNPTIIDTDDSTAIGQLVEVDLPDSPHTRFLRFQCATGRWFAKVIRTKVDTALEANALGYGWRPNTDEDPRDYIAVVAA